MDHLEPAPITSAADPSFALIAGTTKAVFGAEVIVTPTGMYGERHVSSLAIAELRVANTDTAKMWNLSRNLYRFTPAMISDTPNQHTIDEVSGSQARGGRCLSQRISVDAHVNTTRFYYKLIRNADDWAF
jgi:Gly-Xaa carboxypeptidase